MTPRKSTSILAGLICVMLASCFPLLAVAIVVGVKIELPYFMCSAGVATTSLLVASKSIHVLKPLVSRLANVPRSSEPKSQQRRHTANDNK